MCVLGRMCVCVCVDVCLYPFQLQLCLSDTAFHILWSVEQAAMLKVKPVRKDAAPSIVWPPRPRMVARRSAPVPKSFAIKKKKLVQPVPKLLEPTVKLVTPAPKLLKPTVKHVTPAPKPLKPMEKLVKPAPKFLKPVKPKATQAKHMVIKPRPKPNAQAKAEVHAGQAHGD